MEQCGDNSPECGGIGQINLSIQYRKIVSIVFLSSKQKKINNEYVFEIQFECKYEGLNKFEHPLKIYRKFQDFQWLILCLKSQYKNFIIIPYLQNFQKSSAKSLIWSLLKSKSTQPVANQSKQFNPQKNFEEIVIKRLLNILSEISIKFMYKKPGEFENPLFIFIQEEANYNFYRSLYDQQAKRSQSILSGYLNVVFDYIPAFSKKKSIEAYGLGTMRESIEKLYTKATSLMQRLKSYREQLEKVYQNFLKKQHRQQLRLKLKKIETFMYRLEESTHYAHLILSEITSNIQTYVQLTQKSERQVDKYVGQMIEEYLVFVKRQEELIKGSVEKIWREFLEENMKDQQRVKIEIGEMYSNYQKVQ